MTDLQITIINAVIFIGLLVVIVLWSNHEKAERNKKWNRHIKDVAIKTASENLRKEKF